MTADTKASVDSPRREPRGRRAAALIALALGVAGFVISAAGMVIQLLPRQFSAVQQLQIENWEIASRWQQLPAGQIFPPSVSYQLSDTVLQDATPLDLTAHRVSIAPQAGCGAGAITSAAAAVLRRDGCKAILRATYVDATSSYVTTVGVAVLPSDAAANEANQSLSQLRLTAARSTGADRLAAGVMVIRYRGAAGAMYNYNRQISGSFRAGSYLIMYAAGYADSRPHVPVTSDNYTDSEMTLLAQGVAESVADTLDRQPASPHCPGAPGC